MTNKIAEEIVKLNRTKAFIKKYERKDFNQDILDMKRIGGRYVEPSIFENSSSETIINLFDYNKGKTKNKNLKK